MKQLKLFAVLFNILAVKLAIRNYNVAFTIAKKFVIKINVVLVHLIH